MRARGPLNQTQANSIRSDCRARVDAEFTPDVLEMVHCGIAANEELGADLPVRVAGRHEAEHLQLARSQAVALHHRLTPLGSLLIARKLGNSTRLRCGLLDSQAAAGLPGSRKDCLLQRR